MCCPEKECDEISEEEFEKYLKRGLEEKIIDDYEAGVLRKLHRMKEKRVSEVMIKRQNVVAAKSDITVKELLNLFRETGLSMMPVYEKKMDNIVGIVNIKDVIRFLDEEKMDENIMKCSRNPFFVSESKDLRSLFKEMMEKEISLAIVFNEWGGVTGIVTLSDILHFLLRDPSK